MILDIIVIAIVLLSVILGYKHGALSTLISFVGLIISVVVATLLGDYLSVLLYENHISQDVTTRVFEYLSSTQVATTKHTIDAMPYFVRVILNTLQFDTDTQFIEAIKQAPLAASSAVEAVVAPLITSVLRFVITAIVFVIIYLIFRLFLLRPIKSLFKLSFVRGIDSFVGAICSLLGSVLLISFLAFLLRILMPVVDMPYILSESTIYNSYIFYHFYNGNIFITLTSIF